MAKWRVIMDMESLQLHQRRNHGFPQPLHASTAEELRHKLQAYYVGLKIRSLSGIAIVGAASEGRRLSELCRKHAIEIVALADDHSSKIGTLIHGDTVTPVSALVSLDRSIPIVIASHRVLGATERLRAMGFHTVLPFAALQVMAPDLFPPHMFYDGLLDDLANNRDQYLWLHDVLADERSRDVLAAVLAYRQTLDPAMLKSVLDDDDLYAPKGLMRFSDDEVYVDGGSYDGDTIRTFIERVGGRFKAIYAFEPDPVTFKKLEANFASEARVQPFHAGLHSRKGKLRFRDDASRGAIFATDGEIEMPVTTIDDAVGERPVSYIKMNIEGAEIDALHGGRRTIQRSLPRLAISVYHRPSDLWRIPRLVRELSLKYDLYLRQHDGGIIETVLYALYRA
jgi:FkbM family methyltransferase